MAKERSRERASELRKRAEIILAEDPQAIRTMVPADIQKLIYELNVHQIELEMQNEELRRVQLELQEARDKYLNLYDFAPSGYFTLDHNSQIVDVNLAGSELLGSEKHRLIGAQFTSSILPDSQDAFYFHYREVLKTGIKSNCELKMLKADGTPFHAQLISMAMPEKDGNINQCRTAVIDVTERKTAQDTLKESEAHYRELAESISDVFFALDEDLRYTYWNKASEKLTGIPAKDALGKHLHDIFTDSERTRSMEDVYKEVLRLKHPQHFLNEYRLDGKDFSFEIDANPSKSGLSVFVKDITERKRIEKRWWDSMSNFYTVVNNNADGIIVTNREGIVQFINPAAELLFGRKSDDFKGKQFGFPITSADTTEIDIIRKPGDTVVAEMRTVETVWYDKFAHLISLHDITERRQAQQAQERLRQQLQAEVAELEAFSYGIAHDLRSPLVSIEGFSRLLRDDMLNHDAEKVQEDIRLLESGVRKMQGFLNSTLEYSRAGHLVKRTKNVSFSKIVNEAITEFNGQISSIGATVSLADKFPRVYADRTRIIQVLTNLIQNSIKYRDKTVPLKIEIGYRLSEGEVVFFVRDNGLGIDASEAEKVFALFYRGTADGEGSGIGLAIVKKIIEAHEGRIWVQQGQSGKGTTMCFTLPQKSGTNKGDNNEKD